MYWPNSNTDVIRSLTNIIAARVGIAASSRGNGVAANGAAIANAMTNTIAAARAKMPCRGVAGRFANERIIPLDAVRAAIPASRRPVAR